MKASTIELYREELKTYRAISNTLLSTIPQPDDPLGLEDASRRRSLIGAGISLSDQASSSLNPSARNSCQPPLVSIHIEIYCAVIHLSQSLQDPTIGISPPTSSSAVRATKFLARIAALLTPSGTANGSPNLHRLYFQFPIGVSLSGLFICLFELALIE